MASDSFAGGLNGNGNDRDYAQGKRWPHQEGWGGDPRDHRTGRAIRQRLSDVSFKFAAESGRYIKSERNPSSCDESSADKSTSSISRPGLTIGEEIPRRMARSQHELKRLPNR